MAIEAEHFEHIRQRLADDPIVIAMARDVTDLPRDQLCHDDGTPHHDFMLATLHDYRARGGDTTQPMHIGAVAETILRLLEDQ